MHVGEHVFVPVVPHEVVHDETSPGEQTPSPVHVPHVHELEHVCIPHLPHERVAPGWHSPSPVQLPHGPHVQLFKHVLV